MAPPLFGISVLGFRIFPWDIIAYVVFREQKIKEIKEKGKDRKKRSSPSFQNNFLKSKRIVLGFK